MSALRKLFNIIIAIGIICGGVFFAYHTKQKQAEIAALYDHGKLADASISMIHYKKGSKSGVESEFKADISFKTEDSKSISTKIDLDKSEAQLWKETNRIPESIKVRYLAEDPKVAIKDGFKGTPTMDYGIAAAIVVGGFAYLIWALRRRF